MMFIETVSLNAFQFAYTDLFRPRTAGVNAPAEPFARSSTVQISIGMRRPASPAFFNPALPGDVASDMVTKEGTLADAQDNVDSWAQHAGNDAAAPG
jgi:hypothetical protein